MTGRKLYRASLVCASLTYLILGFQPSWSGQDEKQEKTAAKPAAKAENAAEASEKKPTAAGKPDAAGKKKTAAVAAPPIEISASEITYDFNQGLALFIGNVHVVDGAMDMTADEMRVYRNKLTGEFMKVIAIGKKNQVVCKSVDGTAIGSEATYDLAKGQLIMTGRPDLETADGLHFVNSSKIVYDRNTGKFKADGGKVIIPNTGKNSLKTMLSFDEKKDEKKGDDKKKVGTPTAKNDAPPKKPQ